MRWCASKIEYLHTHGAPAVVVVVVVVVAAVVGSLQKGTKSPGPKQKVVPSSCVVSLVQLRQRAFLSFGGGELAIELRS